MREFICDVDGVVASFVEHVINILGLQHISRESIKASFEKTLTGQDLERYEQLLAGPEFWLTLPVIDGAQHGVERLRMRDIKVHWCSSPYDTAPLWHWARAQWLKKYFNSPLSDFTATKEKFRVGGTWFMDDNPENIPDWVARQGGKAFIYDQPHNRSFTGVPRVTWANLSVYIG